MKQHRIQDLNEIKWTNPDTKAAVTSEICKVKLVSKALSSVCNIEQETPGTQGLEKRQVESRLQFYAGVSIAFGVIFIVAGILMMAIVPAAITIAFGVISIAISILFFVLAGFNYAEVERIRNKSQHRNAD
jgi:VIT1/CCC1 family predicted Fe2+/Mn2+ transporter